jgi:ABC-type oligopeptide transport system substrate-binding subunit
VLPKHFSEGNDSQGHKSDITATTAGTAVGLRSYRIKEFVAARVRNYWGDSHPAQIGQNNFNEIHFEFLRDNLAALEAFKADQEDWIAENSAKRGDSCSGSVERAYRAVLQASLERIGISTSIRIVDDAQYQNRLRSFDFDVIIDTWGESLSPGDEQRIYWGPQAADQPGSKNTIGIKNPAVDSLIDRVIYAKDRADLVAATKALDRVLRRIFTWFRNSSMGLQATHTGIASITPNYSHNMATRTSHHCGGSMLIRRVGSASEFDGFLRKAPRFRRRFSMLLPNHRKPPSRQRPSLANDRGLPRTPFPGTYTCCAATISEGQLPVVQSAGRTILHHSTASRYRYRC